MNTVRYTKRTRYNFSTVYNTLSVKENHSRSSESFEKEKVLEDMYVRIFFIYFFFFIDRPIEASDSQRKECARRVNFAFGACH